MKHKGHDTWTTRWFWRAAVFCAVAVLALVILAAAAFWNEADASPLCGPYHEGAKTLAEKYGESVAAEFMTKSGTIILIFADPIDESWTFVERHTDGRACGFKTGKGFEGIRPPGIREKT